MNNSDIYKYINLNNYREQFESYYTPQVALILLDLSFNSANAYYIDMNNNSETTYLNTYFDPVHEFGMILEDEFNTFSALYVKPPVLPDDEIKIYYKHPIDTVNNNINEFIQLCLGNRRYTFQDLTEANSIYYDNRTDTLQYTVEYLLRFNRGFTNRTDFSITTKDELIAIRSQHEAIFCTNHITDNESLHKYLTNHRGIIFQSSNSNSSFEEEELYVDRDPKLLYDITVLGMILYIMLDEALLLHDTRLFQTQHDRIYLRPLINEIPKYNLCIIINISKSHFVTIYIEKDSKIAKYCNPYGTEALPNIKRAIREANLILAEDFTKYQPRGDVWNCGPWAVEILFWNRALQENRLKQYIEDRKKLNISEYRKDHQRVLLDFLALKKSDNAETLLHTFNRVQIEEVDNYYLKLPENYIFIENNRIYTRREREAQTNDIPTRKMIPYMSWINKYSIGYEPYVYERYNPIAPLKYIKKTTHEVPICAKALIDNSGKAFVRCSKNDLLTRIRKHIYRKVFSHRNTKKFSSNCMYNDDDFYKWMVFRGEELFVLKVDNTVKRCVKQPITRKTYFFVPISKSHCNGLTKYIYEYRTIEKTSERRGIQKPSFKREDTVNNEILAFK